MADKLRHIVEGRTYFEGTERYTVFAYCGVEEEASGSGRHTVDVGDVPCEKCQKAFSAEFVDDDFDDDIAIGVIGPGEVK